MVHFGFDVPVHVAVVASLCAVCAARGTAAESEGCTFQHICRRIAQGSGARFNLSSCRRWVGKRWYGCHAPHCRLDRRAAEILKLLQGNAMHTNHHKSSTKMPSCAHHAFCPCGNHTRFHRRQQALRVRPVKVYHGSTINLCLSDVTTYSSTLVIHMQMFNKAQAFSKREFDSFTDAPRRLPTSSSHVIFLRHLPTQSSLVIFSRRVLTSSSQ